MKHHFPFMTAGLALALVACQGSHNDNVANDQTTMATNADLNAGGAIDTTIDAAFVTDAMKGDNGEVAMGKLAQASGSSDAVKKFGATLVTDHGAHKAKLATLAGQAGVPVTDDVTPEAQANMDKLKTMSGDAFDKAFKAMMIDDHNADIAKYEKQASAPDAKTAALAKDTLPTLRKHLELAKAL
jgi:putative membrane protein